MKEDAKTMEEHQELSDQEMEADFELFHAAIDF